LLPGDFEVMWVKQCHKPPIWEWFIASIKMVIWEMVYYCFTHIILVGSLVNWNSSFNEFQRTNPSKRHKIPELFMLANDYTLCRRVVYPHGFKDSLKKHTRHLNNTKQFKLMNITMKYSSTINMD